MEGDGLRGGGSWAVCREPSVSLSAPHPAGKWWPLSHLASRAAYQGTERPPASRQGLCYQRADAPLPSCSLPFPSGAAAGASLPLTTLTDLCAGWTPSGAARGGRPSESWVDAQCPDVSCSLLRGRGPVKPGTFSTIPETRREEPDWLLPPRPRQCLGRAAQVAATSP